MKRAFPNILVVVLKWRFELSICSKSREKQIALGINTTWAMGSHGVSYPRVVAEIPLWTRPFNEKQECVGHVQKRMGNGNRLQTLKTKIAKNLLSDSKTTGGWVRLTGMAMTKIKEYFCNAIRRN